MLFTIAMTKLVFFHFSFVEKKYTLKKINEKYEIKAFFM